MDNNSLFFFSIFSFIMIAVESAAATQIRTFGAWVVGVNFGALIVYIILQVVLAMAVFLFFTVRSLLASAIFLFMALGLSIVETVFAFYLATFAGIVFVIFAIWMLYLFITCVAIWYMNLSNKTVCKMAKSQIRP
jgi:hypothetical protein